MELFLDTVVCTMTLLRRYTAYGGKLPVDTYFERKLKKRCCPHKSGHVTNRALLSNKRLPVSIGRFMTLAHLQTQCNANGCRGVHSNDLPLLNDAAQLYFF